ncbi:hypothetical protein M9H77_22778 [Catharanthus roseus]|uniref:Uncharacterized protein n=1 Tax=Catharanthus roseus TaxID=4058 RepID=A0ACC0AT51_CATRO|nr:hypothetical protein M9H77_22778 [Catharanthus roseus]
MLRMLAHPEEATPSTIPTLFTTTTPSTIPDKKCVWDLVLSMSKVRDAWEDRASIQMRNLMGDIRKDGEISRGEEEARGGGCGNRLALMAIVAGGIRLGRVYGARSEVVNLRAKSSWAPSCRGLTPIGPCCANMLRRMEAVISSVSDAFDEYMMQFLELNHLVQIPPPQILDLVRTAVGTGASTSSPPVPIAKSKAPSLNIAV